MYICLAQPYSFSLSKTVLAHPQSSGYGSSCNYKSLKISVGNTRVRVRTRVGLKATFKGLGLALLRLGLVEFERTQGLYAEISLVARSRSSLTARTTSYSEIALEVVLEVSLLVRLASLTS